MFIQTILLGIEEKVENKGLKKFLPPPKRNPNPPPHPNHHLIIIIIKVVGGR